MSEIQIDPKRKQALVEALQDYLQDELEVEIGQFDAEFLFDFIINKFGPDFYNQGLSDALKVFERRMMDVGDELYEIEKPEQV